MRFGLRRLLRLPGLLALIYLLRVFGLHVYQRLSRNIFWFMAFVLSVAAMVDMVLIHWVGGIEGGTFDWMMRHRIHVAQPDPQLAVVNIDEKSLADMAGDYGRYPWNRGIFAEFVEKLEEQRPRAIVFDIVFSDPDVTNPDQDAYFNEVLGRYDNIYLGMIRLNEENDSLSRLRAGQLPAIQRPVGSIGEGPTLALVVPVFAAALKTPRLGYLNVPPEDDGVVRSYTLEEEKEGWRIPSLALTVARSQGWALPKGSSFPMNWRGPVGTFAGLSFSDVYLDLLRSHHQRPADEFKGKVVLVGVSAAGLSDVTATPMAPVYPGLEGIATALDNLKQGDWLHRIDAPWLTAILALVLIWLTALLFFIRPESWILHTTFGFGGSVLLGVGFLGLSFGNLYIDLIAPFGYAVMFYTTGIVYEQFEEWAKQEVMLLTRRKKGEVAGNYYFAMALVMSDDAPSELARRLLWRLGPLGRRCFFCAAFPDSPPMFGALYGDLLLIGYRGEQMSEAHGTEEGMMPTEAMEGCGMLRRALLGEGRNLDGMPLGMRSMWLPAGTQYLEEAKEAWQKMVAQATAQLRTAPRDAARVLGGVE